MSREIAEAMKMVQEAIAKINELNRQNQELMLDNMRLSRLLVNARMEAEIAKKFNVGTIFGVDMARGAMPAQFTEEEIARLLRLCHPDKHGNSSAANEMTRKLLDIRNKR